MVLTTQTWQRGTHKTRLEQGFDRSVSHNGSRGSPIRARAMLLTDISIAMSILDLSRDPGEEQCYSS